MSSATWRTIFLAAVAALVLWLAYQARAVVTPLLVALVLAYILDPVVRLLERRGLSRGLASAAVVVVALAALVAAVGFAASRFATEAGKFYDDVVGEEAGDAAKADEFKSRLVADTTDPQERERIRARVLAARWGTRDVVFFDRDGDGRYEPGYAAQAAAKIESSLAGSLGEKPLRSLLESATQIGPKLAGSVGAVLAGVVKGGRDLVADFIWWLTVAILFPIYLFYSLVNLSRVHDVAVRHLPQAHRPRIVDILRKIHLTISAFFRGRLITMIAKGALLAALYVAFGVPFSYLCAAFGALASLVPVVGGVAAAIPPIVLSLPNSSGATVTGLVVGILVVEVIEGYVLIPMLVGRRVGLHPLTVLVCTLVAGDLLGFFGMIVAVPLTAVLKILAAEFVLPEVRRRAGLPPRVETKPAPPDAAA
jgi:predicted PurR-regulated permease PerM